MRKLVRITDVILNTTIQADDATTAACDAARKFLTDTGVNFTELWYNDPNVDERIPVLNSLSTWVWKTGSTRTMYQFPILHWTECYDDWSKEVDHAQGLDEIKNSSLLLNKDLIS